MPAWLSNGYYLTLALLLGCTIVGIVVAARFRREVDEDLAPPTARDLLGPLEQAYHSGLMHPAEIERVRESVKKSSKSPVPAPAPGRSSQAASEGSTLFPGDAATDLGVADQAGGDAEAG